MGILLEVKMRRAIVFIVIFSVLLCCVGCDTYEVIKKYPRYVSDCWYCSEINFTFCYEYYEDGRMKSLSSYPLNHNGETLNVTIDFISDYWYLQLDNFDDLITMDEQLLNGSWRYNKGNLVLRIIEDNLFDGKYQELVFIPSSNSPR